MGVFFISLYVLQTTISRILSTKQQEENQFRQTFSPKSPLDWALIILLKIIEPRLSFFLGTAEYNFNFVPLFTRFHWSNNAHVKI